MLIPMKDVKYNVEVKQEDGNVKFIFSCDGGKFGTDEMLLVYELTPIGLLELLVKTYHETNND